MEAWRAHVRGMIAQARLTLVHALDTEGYELVKAMAADNGWTDEHALERAFRHALEHEWQYALVDAHTDPVLVMAEEVAAKRQR